MLWVRPEQLAPSAPPAPLEYRDPWVPLAQPEYLALSVLLALLAKKSLPPVITSQCVLTSSSPSSGTSRFSISATPPPTAVELTILSVLPLRSRARNCNSSITAAPTMLLYSLKCGEGTGAGGVSHVRRGSVRRSGFAGVATSCLNISISLS